MSIYLSLTHQNYTFDSLTKILEQNPIPPKQYGQLITHLKSSLSQSDKKKLIRYLNTELSDYDKKLTTFELLGHTEGRAQFFIEVYNIETNEPQNLDQIFNIIKISSSKDISLANGNKLFSHRLIKKYYKKHAWFPRKTTINGIFSQSTPFQMMQKKAIKNPNGASAKTIKAFLKEDTGICNF